MRVVMGKMDDFILVELLLDCVVQVDDELDRCRFIFYKKKDPRGD